MNQAARWTNSRGLSAQLPSEPSHLRTKVRGQSVVAKQQDAIVGKRGSWQGQAAGGEGTEDGRQQTAGAEDPGRRGDEEVMR